MKVSAAEDSRADRARFACWIGSRIRQADLATKTTRPLIARFGNWPRWRRYRCAKASFFGIGQKLADLPQETSMWVLTSRAEKCAA